MGKSTIIKILGKDSALTDELVCVFTSKKNFFAASTPFWGELKKGAGKPIARRLNKLLFLKHANNITLARVPPKGALKQTLKTLLFFSKEPRRFAAVFSLCRQLTVKVPSYTLNFAKNSTRQDILNALSGR
jgi:hypothetical protein